MATNLPSCFLIQFIEQLLKFLVNFTLLKYVKSQRRDHKRADFWLPNFGFKRSLLSLLKYIAQAVSKKVTGKIEHKVVPCSMTLLIEKDIRKKENTVDTKLMTLE